MEKPTKVEVGQRWREVETYVVVEIRNDGRAKIKFDYENRIHDCWYEPHQITCDTYLGGPSVTGGVCRCSNLPCGGEPHKCGICDKQCPGKPAAPILSRDAVAPKSMDVEAARKILELEKALAVQQEKNRAAAATPQKVAAQELNAAGGYSHVGNLTALQLIKARKPPEPWIPSIDDFDLLPDAPGGIR